MESVRRAVRRWPAYIAARELMREGLPAALARWRVQRRILFTPPVRTAPTGPTEVRVMTYRRDWVNQLWALKTFYHFAGVDWPLVIHDGGLTPRQAVALRRHFPDAGFVSRPDARVRVDRALAGRSLPRCAALSRDNVFGIKLIDYYVLTAADRVLHIDADVLFFRPPAELTAPPVGRRLNRFNRDRGYWYTLPPEELAARTGVPPAAEVNAGLGLVWRESVDLAFVEHCLGESGVGGDNGWLTEQTIHALLAARYGVELLPPAYHCGAGGPPAAEATAKHYPAAVRRLMYTDGMAHLTRTGFLTALLSPTG
jgi:hypothetical protein